jgi:hypothetical protein
MTLTKTLQASNVIEKLRLQLETSNKHLSKFLDEFEGGFESDEKCSSPEIAQDYIDAATYMANVHGRKNNCVRKVQEWLDNYLPY